MSAPTTEALAAPLTTPDDPFLSHCGYMESDRAFCGAPFKARFAERPADREVCQVCDIIAAALGYDDCRSSSL